jgi:hypothetical protein
MSAPVWHAVKQLAAVWRSSTFVQEYAALALNSDVQDLVASAHHIDAQPFLLCECVHTCLGYEHFHQLPGVEAWIDSGGQLGLTYITLLEWLRSRLTGYPFAAAPQTESDQPVDR